MSLTQAQVLKVLAERLDDALLVQLFPGQEASVVRQILRGKQPLKTAAPDPVATSSESGAPTRSKAIGRCRLFTDGASRGNPGQAGAGAVLLTDNGEELVARSVYLGTCTNNVAEYKALLIGLQEALRFGCAELAIALDSELIVRQIEGRYKVKNETLLALFHQVRELLSRFGRWSIMHVPRAQNARADQLANQGIDQKENREVV